MKWSGDATKCGGGAAPGGGGDCFIRNTKDISLTFRKVHNNKLISEKMTQVGEARVGNVHQFLLLGLFVQLKPLIKVTWLPDCSYCMDTVLLRTSLLIYDFHKGQITQWRNISSHENRIVVREGLYSRCQCLSFDNQSANIIALGQIPPYYSFKPSWSNSKIFVPLVKCLHWWSRLLLALQWMSLVFFFFFVTDFCVI